MHKIMFVCHGNICRSTMAEFLMKDLVKKTGKEKEYYIASSGTSYEEYGSPVHYGTKAILDRLGISCQGKRAEKLQKSDYEKYDLFLGMDQQNLRNMLNIFGADPKGKVKLLMDYTKSPRNVADPYYVGNFEKTYSDIKEGILGLLNELENS